jgi:hypothetical protein
MTFFYIDESGNTGHNLFDPHQTVLSYGLLSSKTNVDVLGEHIHEKMLQRLSVDALHANELGNGKLTEIASLFGELQAKMRFDFDYFFIEKQAFALSIFFEAVFDAGLNEAVPWHSYSTPLRFALLLNLVPIIDEELLRRAWKLCSTKKPDKHADEIVKLLTELRERTQQAELDSRTKEVFADAFSFGIAHPLELDFGSPSQNYISPNIICLQYVLDAMGRRIKKSRKKRATRIVIDQQAQFNKSQLEQHYLQRKMAQGLASASEAERRYLTRHPLSFGLDDDTVLKRRIPQQEMAIGNSRKSIGLQIVDIYLWIVNRTRTGQPLSDELRRLSLMFLPRTMTDGMWLQGFHGRLEQFLEVLPKEAELTEEHRNFLKETLENHRTKVQSRGILGSDKTSAE